MATDLFGRTISTNDRVLVGGVVRAISGTRVVVSTPYGRAMHADSGDLILADQADIWSPTLGNFGNSGATNLQFPMGGSLNSTSVGMAAPYQCTLREVIVRALHLDASPLSTWTLNLYKNEAFPTPTETFTFNWSASVNVVEKTEGAPSATISLAKGDGIGIQATGSAQDFPAVTVTLICTRD